MASIRLLNPSADIVFFFERGVPRLAKVALLKIGVMVMGKEVEGPQALPAFDFSTSASCSEFHLDKEGDCKKIMPTKIVPTKWNRKLLDIPALISLVSDVCCIQQELLRAALSEVKRGVMAVRSSPFVIEQLEDELKGNSARLQTLQLVENKLVFCAESAISHLNSLVQTFGSTSEMKRFQEIERNVIVLEKDGLLQPWPHINVIPDQVLFNKPSSSCILALPQSGKIKKQTKLSMATAELENAAPITSNIGFIHALRSSRILIQSHIIPARALSAGLFNEMK
mmetsp:Transcript_38748/g.99477  ORF Transcript_38748/g.99477 Transcript_38748/m.99477 type:complete len:283 (+) Transcript_38748:625-1473(+)